MMATENPLSFSDFNNHSNSAASPAYPAAELPGSDKKVKLMYTSEFLKSFDRTPAKGSNGSLSSEDSGSRGKDDQVNLLKQVIFKIKDLIVERKDELLLNQLNELLNADEVKHVLSPPSSTYVIPPLRFPDDAPFLTPSAQQLLGPHTPQSLVGKSPKRKDLTSPFTPTGSPTVTSLPSSPSTFPSPPPGFAPQPQQQPPQQLTPSKPANKSPHRTPSQTKLNIQPPGLSASGGGNSPSSAGSLSSPSASIPTPPPQLYVPPSAAGLGSNNANSRAIRRSPSMPVIPNNNNNNNSGNNSDRHRQHEVQAQIKLHKKTKSTDELVEKGKKIGLEEGRKLNKSQDFTTTSTTTSSSNNNNNNNNSKGSDAISPRKGIKKSVSMSAICTENDKSAALKCTSLEEIVGQIYPLTKYQAGCRFLQKKLEEQPDPVHVTLVFTEVYEHLVELMTDPYGQYLVPKLMKHCDKAQRQAIVTKIAPKIVTFACHTYGIHGVQKILEYLTDEQVATIVDVIRPSVVTLAKDTKGNYLIQSFLKQFSPQRNQFIFDAILAHTVDVASHKVGCTLLNRCIDYANEPQLSALLQAVAAHALDLVQDQFGNYVIQHVITTKQSFAPLIIKALLGHIPQLSVQKFSSNVIEKCLQVTVSSNPDLYNSIITEITNADLLALLQDRYANFVIQTALDVADETQHARLVKLILPFIHQIKTPYVMHIQKKILQV